MNIPTDLHEQTSVDLEWCNLFRRQKDPRGLVHTIVCKGRSGKERWKASEHRQRENLTQGCRLQASSVFISTSRDLLSYFSIYSGSMVRFYSHPQVRQSSRPEILARAIRTEVCCFQGDAFMIQDRRCQGPSWCRRGELTHRRWVRRMETEQGSLNSSHSWSQGPMPGYDSWGQYTSIYDLVQTIVSFFSISF